MQHNMINASEKRYRLFQEWIGVRKQVPNYSSITFTKEKGISIQEFVAIVRQYQQGVFPFVLYLIGGFTA